MKRHTTSTPGIYYRLLANGERRYEYAITDSTGRRVFKTVPGDKRDCVDARNQVLGRMHRGERVAPSKMTVSQLCDLYLDTQVGYLKVSTVGTYTESIDYYIKPLLGRRKVSELQVLHVAQFVRDLEAKGLSGDTARNALTPLSRMMVFAERSGWRHGNPVKLLDKSERPKPSQKPYRILDKDEIELVIQNCPPASRLLIETAIFTGLRQGELFRLEWNDVDFHAGSFWVRESKTDAGIREVAVMERVMQKLAARALESDSKAVFHSGGISQQCWAGNARADLRMALKRSEITDRFRFHDLRHTYASILISRHRHEDVYVAEQMGHTDAVITKKLYAKLFDSKRRMEEGRKMMDRDFGGVVG